LFQNYLTAAAIELRFVLIEGTTNMSKTLSGRTLSGRIFKGVATMAAVFAVSLAATAASSAATRHVVRASHAQSYYNYVPNQIDPPGLTAGQLGRRTDPVLVAPGGYGPPDPASCGGFHC
jgi:hypothetical protein